jgi:hypothetical protein|tara:strand:+ start:354 stop:512 length:159 start_codon:yes stop_codon:yes gene_type:complete
MKEIHLIDKQVIINIMDKIEKEYDVDNIKQDSLDAFLHLWDDLKEAIYAKKR